MAKGNSAFSPANGSSRDDVGDSACYITPAAEPNLMARGRDRKPYGGRPGALSEPVEGGWEKQGHMVQPLPDGFNYPSSQANIRRENFQLDMGTNFDPVQALPPRVKRSKDSE